MKYLLKKLPYNFEVKISKSSGIIVFAGSPFSASIIQNIPLESKQITDYCFRRVKAVNQETFFGMQMAGVWNLKKFDDIFL